MPPSNQLTDVLDYSPLPTVRHHLPSFSPLIPDLLDVLLVLPLFFWLWHWMITACGKWLIDYFASDCCPEQPSNMTVASPPLSHTHTHNFTDKMSHSRLWNQKASKKNFDRNKNVFIWILNISPVKKQVVLEGFQETISTHANLEIDLWKDILH